MRETTERYTVGDLALETVPCLGENVTLRDVALVLVTSRAGTVIVTAEPLVVVTERDVLRAIGDGCEHDAPMTSVQTDRPPIACESSPVSAVLRAMVQHDARSLVVVDAHDRPIGLVTLPAVLDIVLGGPSWLAALRLALHIERSTP